MPAGRHSIAGAGRGAWYEVARARQAPPVARSASAALPPLHNLHAARRREFRAHPRLFVFSRPVGATGTFTGTRPDRRPVVLCRSIGSRRATTT